VIMFTLLQSNPLYHRQIRCQLPMSGSTRVFVIVECCAKHHYQTMEYCHLATSINCQSHAHLNRQIPFVSIRRWKVIIIILQHLDNGLEYRLSCFTDLSCFFGSSADLSCLVRDSTVFDLSIFKRSPATSLASIQHFSITSFKFSSHHWNAAFAASSRISLPNPSVHSSVPVYAGQVSKILYGKFVFILLLTTLGKVSTIPCLPRWYMSSKHDSDFKQIRFDRSCAVSINPYARPDSAFVIPRPSLLPFTMAISISLLHQHFLFVDSNQVGSSLNYSSMFSSLLLSIFWLSISITNASLRTSILPIPASRTSSQMDQYLLSFLVSGNKFRQTPLSLSHSNDIPSYSALIPPEESNIGSPIHQFASILALPMHNSPSTVHPQTGTRFPLEVRARICQITARYHICTLSSRLVPSSPYPYTLFCVAWQHNWRLRISNP
jgi:hypothetical protein